MLRCFGLLFELKFRPVGILILSVGVDKKHGLLLIGMVLLVRVLWWSLLFVVIFGLKRIAVHSGMLDRAFSSMVAAARRVLVGMLRGSCMVGVSWAAAVIWVSC